MSTIQHLQNNKIKAIFWFIFFVKLHITVASLQFDGKLIEAFEFEFWRNAIQIENVLINFSREIAIGQDKFVILVLEFKRLESKLHEGKFKSWKIKIAVAPLLKIKAIIAFCLTISWNWTVSSIGN